MSPNLNLRTETGGHTAVREATPLKTRVPRVSGVLLPADEAPAHVRKARTHTRSTSTATFVWPKTVQEFLNFDPHYTQKWLKSRNCPQDLIEDFSQSLLLHLCTPNKECKREGYPDKLMLYKPARMGDATTLAAWAYWLGRIFSNQYGKLIKEQRRSGTAGPNVISLADENYSDRVSNSLPTWWLLLEPYERPYFETSDTYTPVTSNMLLDEVLQVISEEIGEDAIQVLEAVAETDSAAQAAQIMGVQPRLVHRTLKQIRQVLGAVLGLNIQAIQKILKVA